MQNLKELVTIVNQVKIRDISIVGRGRHWNGHKTKELFEGIAKGTYTTDEEAALAIYGENYSKTSYTSLKKHLTDRLLNTLFFIRLSDTPINDFQKIYFDIHKLNSVVKILAGKGSKVASIKIAERLITKSLQYQFTEVNLSLAKLLRRHYRVYKFDAPKASKYDAIVKEQLQILIEETKVEDYYEQLIAGLKNKRSSKDDLAEKGKVFATAVRLIYPKTSSLRLRQFSNLVFVLEHELSRDFEKVEIACNEAISDYEKLKAFASVERTLVFYIKLLITYIPLQKFKKGEFIAEKILGAISIGSVNWFLTLDHYFLLSMHTGNYEKAASILQQATKNKALQELDTQYKEIWIVYEAYIAYLKEAEILKKESEKNFRVARFMNQVTNFSRDKTGINISILIIQSLLLIAQEKETKVIDKVEALRTYVYTHLRKDESLRSNVFIKMLLKTVESKFHKNGTIRRTKTLRQKLSESPIGTKGYSQYIEIIPYETLWEISLKFLSNRAF